MIRWQGIGKENSMHRIALGCSSIFISVSTAVSMPYGLGCATDVTTDGVVGVNDILFVVDRWGTTDDLADCNRDGEVGISDILMIIDEWGSDCDSIHPFEGNTTVEFDYIEERVIISYNGIPNHPTGPFDGSTGCYNPNDVSMLDIMYSIPMHPEPTNNPSVDLMAQPGPIATAINGVPFYNPYDAGGIDAPSTICFDDYNGHPSPDGRYHYHQWSAAFDDVKTNGHSQVVGYAFDGYPIFGPWESDTDYAHESTTNPLDDCHGHYDAVRGYHYHTSLPYDEDSNGFPWVMGCYSGQPEESNFNGGGGGGGGCDACAQNMIPPPVCNCVHNAPGYAYCCTNWDAACQAYSEQFCNGFAGSDVPTQRREPQGQMHPQQRERQGPPREQSPHRKPRPPHRR